MEILHVTLDQYPIDDSETHYAFHNLTNSLSVLHDHDFYELLLIVSGSMHYQLGQQKLFLPDGSLVLMRPGDEHCKIYSSGLCQNINLAFPRQTIDSLFDFIYDSDTKRRLDEMDTVPVIQLSQSDKKLLQQDLERLNLLPVNRRKLIRMHLRFLLLDIFKKYFSDFLLDSYLLTNRINLPSWLNRILQQMSDPSTFSFHLDDWAELADKSKEYFCRSFQKYLETTPSAYLNTLHLNYAANLLAHTDSRIIDIAYDSGFQSLSYFYHLFNKEFGVSPLMYRKHIYSQFPKPI